MRAASVHALPCRNTLCCLARPASFLVLFSCVADAALAPHLLKDINTNTESALFVSGLSPVLDGVAYFSAIDAEHGRELWRSDGTAEGTWLVKDLLPGVESSAPAYFVVWQNTLWFTARVETNRVALFQSDGTSNGTVVIKDGFFGYPNLAAGTLQVAGNALFFSGNDGTNGLELWKTDGTPAGTTLLKDIWLGRFGSQPSVLTALGDLLVFRAFDDDGAEPWRTDGTAAGTFPLRDIAPGPTSGNPTLFTALGTNLLFAARNGTELWRTDGTTNGTTLLYRFTAALPSDSILYITQVGTQVFFRASINGDRELWRSDGTSHGTLRVADLNPGGSSYPNSFVDFNGVALFSADNGAGYQLWRSDGTPAGTWAVTGTNGARVLSPYWLVAAGDRVYFSATSAPDGTELWRTDGTSNQTYRVKDISPGPGSSSPQVVAVMDDFVLFAASTREHGTELWRTDGTEAGTVMVKDINRQTAGANPSSAAQVGDTLFFGTAQGALWKTDGTSNATERVAQLQDESLSENRSLSKLQSLNDVLLFVPDPKLTTNGQELWTSDGTSAGTRLLKDISPGTSGSAPRNFTRVGGTIFFSATGTNGTELWRTDATEAGTVEVKDIYRGPASSSPSFLTEYHGQLFFHALRDSSHSGLWKSDGTADGTVLLLDLTNSAFGAMTRTAEQLLFFGYAGTNTVLWASRGTPQTTMLVGPLPPRTTTVGAAGPEFIGRSDLVLFASGDDVTGTELWRTDGTVAGTRLVKDIRPGPDSSYPRSFINAGNLTYFQANDGAHGVELWRTDGTEQGTRLLKDIYSGPLSSLSSFAYFQMAEVNGLVFFWAYEPEHGTELWMTDGTEEGTTLVADLNPSRDVLASPNGPDALLTGTNGRLFFTANDGLRGNELWTLTVPSRAVLTVTGDPSRLVLRAAGDPGQELIVERSEDLRTWLALQTNVAGPTGQIQLTNSPAPPAGYYRTRTPVSGAR